ncbi:MAG: hypothetical protein EXR99_04875 [Gemmataceae bacterium]|nr:hypothetical protein [Gemmataceae bacterium]
MIRVLVWKLLRDLRLILGVTCILLAAFQVLWALVMRRIIGELAPFFHGMAGVSGIEIADMEKFIFGGPGKMVRSILGGEAIDLNTAMDMLSVGFIHPLVQTLLCVWAVGRAAGALAGEIDRGTMELLLSQPVSRGTLVFAHFLVDCITIPMICLSIWLGSLFGYLMINPLELKGIDALPKMKPVSLEVSVAGFKFKVNDPLPKAVVKPITPGTGRLEIRPLAFAKGLLATAGILFSIIGLTMVLSSLGRFRFRVLGYAVFILLIMFLANVIGQIWEPLEWVRPFTIFYYYQPQLLILDRGWTMGLKEWNGGKDWLAVPFLPVLFGTGALGYLAAWAIFKQRDIPAPI